MTEHAIHSYTAGKGLDCCYAVNADECFKIPIGNSYQGWNAEKCYLILRNAVSTEEYLLSNA